MMSHLKTRNLLAMATLKEAGLTDFLLLLAGGDRPLPGDPISIEALKLPGPRATPHHPN